MKKQFIVIGMTLLLLAVGLSGCTNPNPNPEPKDSDGDGYLDSKDDFPFDDEYYDKDNWGTFLLSGRMEIEPREGHSGWDYLSSEWKYVFIEWEVIEPTSLTKEQEENIFFTISNPENPYIEYSYASTGNRNIKIYITANNWGDWNIHFLNKNYDITIKIERTIYKVR